ncbi:cancer-related nucleoside-triphosphatase homolog isoform X2 [Littorina saxatilis]|uniref:cancer-related nucleoside-triphosphatase homolog isoform X2 n=1 Tax=Littorina saxatilis TaxID=31220 RepID=UPI0038B44A4F
MATSVPARLILLTGPPGVGKTTLVQKACTALKETNTPVQGFYTEEVRSGGRRIGFDVVTLCGNRGPLARIDSDGSGQQQREHKVGQYSVKLNAFEQTALPVLRIPASSSTAPPVIVVDEVGKMEMFSTTFVQMVRTLVSRGNTTVLATIPIPKGRPIPLVEELRSHKDAHVFEISKSNRDSLLQDIVSAVQLSRKTYSCQR